MGRIKDGRPGLGSNKGGINQREYLRGRDKRRTDGQQSNRHQKKEAEAEEEARIRKTSHKGDEVTIWKAKTNLDG